MTCAVVVIGAGVIGLTSAVRLAESGHPVQVVSAERPDATTSAVAGALWGPWLVEPRDRVLPWAEETMQVLRELAEEPGSGVRITTGMEVSTTHYEPPDWSTLLTDRTPCPEEALPPGYRFGVRYSAPLVDMPVHLAYLMARFRKAGGSFRIERLTSLDQATSDSEAVVVNCSGVGARQLVPDSEVYPVRGYHVVVTNPGLTEFVEADTGDSNDLLAIYPHDRHVLLGGTAEPHVWSREPDDAIATAIVERCARLEPRLADAEVLEHRIGLRPTRPEIRLEADYSTSKNLVIQNYGHGGAGVSLAWGCAAEVHDMIRAYGS